MHTNGIPDAEQLLPQAVELELASHLMGMCLEQLGSIVDSASGELGGTLELGEYLDAQRAGVKLAEQEHDRAELLELLLFATSTLNDAEEVRRRARNLRDMLVDELTQRPLPPRAMANLAERVRGFHERALGHV